MPSCLPACLPQPTVHRERLREGLQARLAMLEPYMARWPQALSLLAQASRGCGFGWVAGKDACFSVVAHVPNAGQCSLTLGFPTPGKDASCGKGA